MIIAGIGCKKGVSKDDVLAAIRAALALYGLEISEIEALAVPEEKTGERGIHEAAQALGLVVLVINRAGMEREAGRTLSRSQLSMETTGAPSASEAAALASMGEEARLLGPRIVVGPATCALAISEAAQ